MLSGERCWTVSCARCDVLVGIVDGGRFVHNPDCAQPLSIGRGVMRCCDCGGELTVTEQTVVEATDEIEDDDDDELADYDGAPLVRLLAFQPTSRGPREAGRGH
jgi:hypothetical protein